MSNENVNDVKVQVFAQKPNGRLVSGFTSFPAPQNVNKRIQKFRDIGSDLPIPRPALQFGKDKADLLKYWKKNDYTIFVKACNQSAVQVYPKVKK